MGEEDHKGPESTKRERRFFLLRAITITFSWLETAAGTVVFGYLALTGFLLGLSIPQPEQGWSGLALFIGVWTATLISYRSPLYASIVWAIFSFGLLLFVIFYHPLDLFLRINVGVPLIVVGFALGGMNLVVYFYQNLK